MFSGAGGRHVVDGGHLDGLSEVVGRVERGATMAAFLVDVQCWDYNLTTLLSQRLVSAVYANGHDRSVETVWF
jgi:hypothetical protein